MEVPVRRSGWRTLLGLLGAWWWFVAPGLCIAALGAGLTFINFGIDEIANPRLRREAKPKALKTKEAVAS